MSSPWGHLVIVCCHAFYVKDKNLSPLNEEAWHLKPFQRSHPKTNKTGEHETFVEHILEAARHGSGMENYVVFSGGKTDKTMGISESQSYKDAFSQLAVCGEPPSGRPLAPPRLGLEEHATDSYQNLLFSIIKYRQTHGRYPERITVITHKFKARRFVELHAQAIRWPLDRIKVAGKDPPWASQEEEAEVIAAEEENAMLPFRSDLYGVGEVLGGKRIARSWNPACLDEICDGLEPEVQALLRWNQPTLFDGALPWSE
ncbi:hypothetical protein CAC42_1772 [Sphaceloma murrayae]|uniref:Uncharacterized protein n=1 Tax=Sphaceloma murrayae TaxID=2082308 RepID=A0A2K1QVF0_9PEZI|nr:hypothetical protein CAC42_1772 [Sphaceloma murrayae]